MDLKNKPGFIIVLLTLLITINLWVISKVDPAGYILANPLRSFGQIAGLVGTIMFCWEFVFITRAPILEDLFGGLDKVYKYHHTIGGSAILVLLTHPIMFFLASLPNFKLGLNYVIPSANLSYSLGVIAIYSLGILLAITFWLKIPYHIWKQTHQLMGIPLSIAILHILLINSDISRSIFLKGWILIWCSIAMCGFLYKRVLYGYNKRAYAYTVSSINLLGDVVEIYLKPASEKSIGVFTPGQFVFLQFKTKALGKEIHPFSLSSDPDSEVLRISAKNSGDYTAKMDSLKAGDEVKVFGPHGRFGERSVVNKTKGEVWIAGGIGVTPFLSMMRSQAIESSDKKINFIYAGNSQEATVYEKEIRDFVSSSSKNINYLCHYSSDKGRLKASDIAKLVENIEEQIIFLCGPVKMMEDLAEQFVKLGVKSRNIIYEDFNLK